MTAQMTDQPSATPPATAPIPSLGAQLLQPPNAISWGRIAMLIICALLWTNGWKLTGLAIGFVAGIGDYFDGILARRMGLVSPLGAALDQWSDNVYESCGLIYGAMIGIFPRWIIWFYLLREFSMVFIRTVSKDRGITVSSGIWGKVKTNFLHYGILFGYIGATEAFPLAFRSFAEMLGWMGAVGGLMFSYASAWIYLRQFVPRYEASLRA
jgi:phosphatidylglycerophosphate synthase